MEIKVRDEQKNVEIWLTRADRKDPAVQAELERLYRFYWGKHYLMAVFQSGEEDLTEQTSSLLCYNCRRQAEKEVQEQKKLGMTI